ncbi:hypothetical protein BDR22DRAFT_590505 [Usnea florida]
MLESHLPFRPKVFIGAFSITRPCVFFYSPNNFSFSFFIHSSSPSIFALLLCNFSEYLSYICQIWSSFSDYVETHLSPSELQASSIAQSQAYLHKIHLTLILARAYFTYIRSNVRFPPNQISLSFTSDLTVSTSALMSVDIRQSLTCLRYPSRFETVSRTQLSKEHSGDLTRPIDRH